MAKLILSMDGLVLKEVPLTKERTTIGRRPHNDIVIDNLAVSGEHAVIVTILNDSFLEDLGSTNGTMVNSQPIKKHFLQNNDMVELGKYKLKFISDAAKPSSTHDFEKTMVLRNSGTAPGTPGSPTASMPGYNAAATQPSATLASAEAAPAAGPKAVIQILNGPNAGKELALTKALTTLGRPGVQVAVLTRRPQGYFITHVEGANYPVVNGTTLTLEAHPLNNHDVLELSGTKMEFFFK